jgi:HEAT repeat protein
MYWLTLWKTRSKKSRKRRQAIEELAVRHGRRATDRLLEALCDEEYDVHLTAKEGLNSIDPNWATTDVADRAIRICEKALAHERFFVRAHAIETLGLIGTPEAAQKLLPLLSIKSELRTGIVAALGNIKDAQVAGVAIGPLCDLLLSNNHPAVRGQVTATLEKIGDERAVEALILAIRKDPSAGCVQALEAILRRTALRVETSLLRELKRLGSLEGQAIDYGGITGETIGGTRIVNVPTTRVEIDSSELNRLAREELGRREAKEA